jgi:hypothetical protein
MMASRRGRTQTCGVREARARLDDARAQLDLVEVVGLSTDGAERKAAISAAVLAGIAAADAASCARLGERSRSQDHRDATRLVQDIVPGGGKASRDLAQLLDLKDASHYGFEDLSGAQLTAAVRRARTLVGWAEKVVRG